MNGTQHSMLGIYAGAMAAYELIVTSPEHINIPGCPVPEELIAPMTGLFVMCSLAGSLLPDIDAPSSSIGKIIPPISKLINKMCGHRGVVHSLLAGFVFSALLYLPFRDSAAGIFPSLGLMLGYTTHLLQDMCTTMGVAILFPSNKKISLCTVKSGSPWNAPCTIIIGLLLTILFMRL